MVRSQKKKRAGFYEEQRSRLYPDLASSQATTNLLEAVESGREVAEAATRESLPVQALIAR